MSNWGENLHELEQSACASLCVFCVYLVFVYVCELAQLRHVCYVCEAVCCACMHVHYVCVCVCVHDSFVFGWHHHDVIYLNCDTAPQAQNTAEA